jgi:hypothetical protein
MIQQPARLTSTPPEKPTPRRSAVGSGVLRAGIVVVVCLALAVPVVLAIGSTPTPATLAAGASAAPTASPREKTGLGWAPWAWGKTGGQGNGFQDGHGRGPITITVISGSTVSLATQDGWTRTITVTPETKITKGGQTITVGDLKVGDEVRFTQKRNADGTYTITAVVVPTPVTGGEVTAVTDSAITIKKRDASTQVITVTSSTIYTLGKVAGSRADVTLGVGISAEGTVDGSTFTALSVHVALAHATGTVTAVAGSTITIKDHKGATTVIHVSSSTTFKVRGKDAATIADIAVGDRVQIDGTRRSDGGIDAVTVVGGGPKGDKAKWPKASPTASTPSS